MQSTWAADSNTWAGNAYIWNNDTYQVTASMTQTNLTQSLLEDTVFPRGITVAGNFGMTGSTAHVMPAAITLENNATIAKTHTLGVPVTATLAGTGGMSTHTPIALSITMGMTSATSSSNKFLWNNEEEDTGTTWTKVSDPDE